jgi:PASTA domain/Regulator of chromosome condensation (RCC1) repeat
VTAVAAATDHSVALKGDGTVVAWGCGAGTDFGQGSVPSGLSGVTAISAGYAHSLALRGDGTVVAWGCGGGYDLGQCSIPSGLFGVTAVAAGLWHSLALVVPMNQTITFGPLANKTYGDPDFAVSATASSGLALSCAASGRCTLSGAAVHLTGAGSCTVTASQPGNRNYNAATEVSRTFSIAPAPCRVPRVVGKRVASAKRTIAQRHCRTGKVHYAYSRTRKQGVVISQSRRPGRVLPARSKINLIVSRGRRR